MIFAALLLAVAGGIAPLSPAQQSAVLDEALAAYDRGVEYQTTDPIAARTAFERSANRFQVLVDEGVENGRLFYDLGNAQLQAGATDKAIAAYLAAERYIPGDGRLAANLEHARTLAGKTDEKASSSWLSRLAFWHRMLPTRTRLGLAATGWILLWLVLSLRLIGSFSGWRILAIIGAVTSLLFGASVIADIASQRQFHGALVTKQTLTDRGDNADHEKRPAEAGRLGS
ncbi:MAG: hypothetical protein QGG74_03895 [Phycisphaerales bacterium]|jgi:tetratricopeptide (TPR) repeat protein|nr:hypothetical protein [Phycisphaerales bacterium]MDP6987168.1 hypothetical protein [Phycisphaerales bacterium]